MVTYSKELLGARDDVTHDESSAERVDDMLVVGMKD